MVVEFVSKSIETIVQCSPHIEEQRVLCIWNVLELEMGFGQGPGHFQTPMLAALAQHSDSVQPRSDTMLMFLCLANP